MENLLRAIVHLTVLHHSNGACSILALIDLQTYPPYLKTLMPVTDYVQSSASRTSGSTVLSLKTDELQEKITQLIRSEGPCPAGTEAKPALATTVLGSKMSDPCFK